MVIVVKAAESSQAESVLHAKCTAFMTRQLEPYGRVYCKRILDGPGDQDGPDQSAPANERVEDDLEDEQEPESLLSRDPREWKVLLLLILLATRPLPSSGAFKTQIQGHRGQRCKSFPTQSAQTPPRQESSSTRRKNSRRPLF